MRAAVCITVAAMIALHTVLGCCWHHSHTTPSVAAGIDAKTTAPTKAIKRCCCHKRLKDQARLPEQDSQRQDSKKPCPTPCSEKCDSAAVNRTTHHELTWYCDVAFSTAPDQPLLIPNVPTLRGEFLNFAVESPPLRLHLLHQLLLI